MESESDITKMAWSFKVGDRWTKIHICTANEAPTITIDDDSLLMQVRDRHGNLVVSTGSQGDAEGVIKAVFTNQTVTDQELPVIEWETEDDTASVIPNRIYWFEMQATEDGQPVTIFTNRRFYVVSQVARGAL